MSMLKAKVNKILEDIGKKNGTAAPQSQDPGDTLAHEYLIASQMSSYADKRKKIAKEALEKGINTATLGDTRKAVAATEVSTTVSVLRAAHYSVIAKVNNGASYLDTASLRVELLKMMTTDAVDQLFERHTKRRVPTVTYEVVPDAE